MREPREGATERTDVADSTGSDRRGAARARERARSLAERCVAGERAALARAISLVEDRRAGYRELLARVAAHGRRARRTGIAGPPGAGKSTLAAALAGHWRGGDQEVAILAVDPTSPYSGGALLGDRVRMAPLRLDGGVFIRSMATRGAGGGLSDAAHDVVDLVEGSGYGRILLETVGVGQAELGVATAADTVVVVLTPESGDAVQAMKAGLAEVADILVVNKADRPGARALVRHLRDAVALGRRGSGDGWRGAGSEAGDDARGRDAGRGGAPTEGIEFEGAPTAYGPFGGVAGEIDVARWRPPVLTVVATTGEGVEEVAAAIDRHERGLVESGVLEVRRVGRAQARIRAAALGMLEARLDRLGGGEGYARAAKTVVNGRGTVYEAARRLLVEGGIPAGGGDR